MTADDWIAALQLRPHPEGGFFRESYRAEERVAAEHLPARFGGDRAFSTAIYFLLRSQDFSALHTVKQDEVWHHYDGSPLTLHIISQEGAYSTVKLGRGLQSGATPQAVVGGGLLFGATVDEPASFALVGCTVAPGFDFQDFRLPSRQELLANYPGHRAVVERLTRGD